MRTCFLYSSPAPKGKEGSIFILFPAEETEAWQDQAPCPQPHCEKTGNGINLPPSSDHRAERGGGSVLPLPIIHSPPPERSQNETQLLTFYNMWGVEDSPVWWKAISPTWCCQVLHAIPCTGLHRREGWRRKWGLVGNSLWYPLSSFQSPWPCQ